MTQNETEMGANQSSIDFNAIKVAIDNSNNAIGLRFCKKIRQNGISTYSFHNAPITDGIENSLRKWLKGSIEWIENNGISDNEAISDNTTCFQTIELDSILNWEQFREKAFQIAECEPLNISKYKSNLHCQIIFSKTDDGEYIFGQISKITPTFVIKGKKEYYILHDGSTFNEIFELSEGVRLKKYANFFFIMSESLNKGIIVNQQNFESIFDMNEQYEREAISCMRNSAIFNLIINSEDVLSTIQSDRNIQKMLRNPVTIAALSTIDQDSIMLVKSKLGTLLPYNITNEGKIEFIGENEKEEVKEFIKSISHHYSDALWGGNIIEGTPNKMIQL